ncbi:hypothetical protein VTO73DRAFT_14243 [Trametes versicolor]
MAAQEHLQAAAMPHCVAAGRSCASQYAGKARDNVRLTKGARDAGGVRIYEERGAEWWCPLDCQAQRPYYETSSQRQEFATIVPVVYLSFDIVQGVVITKSVIRHPKLASGENKSKHVKN